MTALSKQQASPSFTKEVRHEVDELFSRYPKKVYALLPLLHIVQRENDGWIPEQWIVYVADLCETTINHVRGVITFYNMFKTTPPGKHHVMVCTCVPCGLCGGLNLLEHLEERLGIVPGKTTADGLFSLEEAQCLAACDEAPLLWINQRIHGKLNIEGVDKLLADLGHKPKEPHREKANPKKSDQRGS